MSNAETRAVLDQLISGPLVYGDQTCLAVIVLANGPQGAVWALEKLGDARPAVRLNAMMSLRFSHYSEVLEAYVAMLGDKDSVVLPKGPKWEPPPMRHYEYRICDLALRALLRIFKSMEIVLSQELVSSFYILPHHPISERDQTIGKFKQMWQNADDIDVGNDLSLADVLGNLKSLRETTNVKRPQDVPGEANSGDKASAKSTAETTSAPPQPRARMGEEPVLASATEDPTTVVVPEPRAPVTRPTKTQESSTVSSTERHSSLYLILGLGSSVAIAVAAWLFFRKRPSARA